MLAGFGRCLCRGDEGLAGVVGEVGGFRLLVMVVGVIGGLRLLARVVIHYKNKIFEKSFEILVSEDKVEVKPTFNTKYILVSLLIVLIIISALFYQKNKKSS